MTDDFRFAVGISSVRSRAKLQETACRFEDSGFDVLNIPDHLGAPAPFPVLTAVAQATSKIRVGSYVMNAAFYSPALLARDAAEVHTLSDGRLDLGLGAGYVREEFEAAEIPFPTAGQRVSHLEHVTQYLRRHHPEIPLLIAGNGDRVLTIAAQHADIVGLTGTDRVEFVRTRADGRPVVLDLAITAAPSDDSGMPDLTMPRRYAPQLSDEEILALPGVLSGTPRDAADRLRALREQFGVTSFSVQKKDSAYFAKVIAELR
ncbi:TIGR03621 family F420-dependent LLM class oxidoreductase [[Mycobacterium] burgundiense]|uniref:TIGR03621 family F420-dependent LLM class oxidoreductase n=1 Tax=[Mycobacterium] burgundiense TaxID=3064286 RepID=A0ABM9LCZ5_9MYCO|nr:TIGR03621 family F420-dependent LLM class oxidoreductase [Mycolicibacterium sp. MU0053]CAJ1496923.1 TIGR03621 family F420-dependent LLM class oxidoreductase [Mycolicibacterium sp. MU0053]